MYPFSLSSQQSCKCTDLLFFTVFGNSLFEFFDVQPGLPENPSLARINPECAKLKPFAEHSRASCIYIYIYIDPEFPCQYPKIRVISLLFKGHGDSTIYIYNY